jgi:hypothetical protein
MKAMSDLVKHSMRKHDPAYKELMSGSVPPNDQPHIANWIDRLYETIEAQAAELTRLREQCEAKDAEIERLKAERDEIKKAAIRDANTIIECLEASNSNAIASLSAENERLRKALDAAAAVDGDAQWKPIETAPKAGRFLIGGPTITGRTPPWRIEIVSYRDKSGMPIMSVDLFEATHWMPLPAPPSAH